MIDTVQQKINPNEIQFIRPLDDLMKTFQSSDKEYFCQLLQRKKALIQSLLSIGIDSQKYFALISKIFRSESPLKQFAKADLVSLKHQHQMNKETWFQDIVIQTQTALTEQQTLYNKYKSQKQAQKQQHHKPRKASEHIMPNINMTQVTNFKLFDELMQKYYQTPYKQIFIDLFEKKQRILLAIQSGKLTPQLYFDMSNKAFHQTKNEEVKNILKDSFDYLQLICDGDKKNWLKQTIKESKSLNSQQKAIYELHQKGQIVNKKQVKLDVDIDELMNTKIPEDTDPNDCISFLVLDRYMGQNKENPQVFIPLYEKKQQMLNQIEQKKLNEKNYRQRLQKKLKSLNNQTLKQIYQQELNDVVDIHGGNEKKWFEHIVEESKIDLMVQEDIYENLKVNYKPQKQQRSQVKQTIKRQDPKIQQSTKVRVSHIKQQKSSLPFSVEKMFSLKVIEDAFLIYEQNTQAFIRLFSQKQKIIEMMKKGELDAEKYKKLQQKMLSIYADNQAVKQEIEMDLQGIKDFHEGDVNKWFEETVERAGEYYETQLEKYNQLTKDLPKQNKKNQIEYQKNQKVKEAKRQQKPKSNVQVSQKQTPEPFNIAKMMSLKVLDDSLTEHAQDQQLFMKLFAQKQRIIQLMQNGKLDATKYKKLQQRMIEEFKEHEFIKDSISFELDEINDMHDGDIQKWFQEVVQNAGTSYQSQLEKYQLLKGKYEEKQQNKNEFENQSMKQKRQQPKAQCNQKQFESKLSQASSQINHATIKSKIRHYLLQMAPYQSLINYYQKNGLNPNENPILKIYIRIPRNQIPDIIEKIKTDQNFDIVSYCQKFFPTISPSIFYQGNENYEQKLQKGIILCKKEVQSLKDYTKLLRKALNIRNLQKVKERLSICQQNIKYLTDLIATLKNTNKLILLPLIEITPVNYQNIDQNTNLQQNEVELNIVKIQDLDGDQFMKVYFSGQKIQELTVKNGPLNLHYKRKIQDSQSFIQMLKGQIKCFEISIYKVGWFSNTKIGQQKVQMLFIRSNIHEGKVQVGNATIFYEAKVRNPKSPMLTEIKQVNITKYPPYQQSKQVQQQFIKKYTLSNKQK